MIDVSGKRGLNIGCGNLDQGSHLLNVDIRHTPIVDLICDLQQFPWPFPDGWADEIQAVDVLEHIVHMLQAVEECGRILKPGGLLRVRTTHWQTEQSYRMLDHFHFCTPSSFDIFDPRTEWGRKYPWYTLAKFEVRVAQMSGEELEFQLVRL